MTLHDRQQYSRFQKKVAQASENLRRVIKGRRNYRSRQYWLNQQYNWHKKSVDLLFKPVTITIHQ